MLNLTPKQYRMVYNLKHVDEIFWGGQAGGGKSEGLLMFALRRRLENPGSAGLMMRKTFPDLDRSLIRKSFDYYRPFAKWNEAKRKWVFKNGSLQDFGYCESDKDVYQYQSAEYDDISMDELTHFTEFQYTYMMSRLRSRMDLKTLMRSAGNPGNIGHAWVKARFVDCAREKIHSTYDEFTNSVKTRYFLPASLDDNTLMAPAARAQYKSWLAQLPEAERKMLMEGDWDYVPGAAFGELDRRIHGYNAKEFSVPAWATIFMSYDFGFGKPFSIGWWWIDYDGRMWRFAEWYGYNGQADKGLRMPLSKVAEGILKREEILGIQKRVNHRVAGHDIFAKTANIRGGGQGPPIAETLAEHGVIFMPGDPDRLLGKQQVHTRLAVPDDYNREKALGLPLMMISNDCEQFWRTVPTLVVDDNNIEDVYTKQEDHCFQGLTEVFTEKGLTPIKELVGKTGKILTVFGQWTEYHDVRKTRTAVKLVELTYSNDFKVQCTPDHKFLAADGSWIKAVDMKDEISYVSISQHNKRDMLCKLKLLVKLSRNLTVKDIGFVVTIFKEKAKGFTSLSGNITTGRFLKNIISTIETMIDRIINLRIWKHGRDQGINPIMGRKGMFLNGLMLCNKGPQNGMAVNRAGNGIKNNTRKIAENLFQKLSLKPVNNAERDTRQKSLLKKEVGSVRPLADNAFIISKALMKNPEYVLSAVKHGKLTSSKKQRLVALLVRENYKASPNPLKVESIKSVPNDDVYCLVAEGTHCFALQHGIVVSNCYDEIKIACMSRPISPAQIKPGFNKVQKIIKTVQTMKNPDILDVIFDY